MSKKEMTTGEEFEDFLKFAMKYRPQKRRVKSKSKERTCFTPSEVRDIFKQNNLTDESLYKRLLGMGESSDNGKGFGIGTVGQRKRPLFKLIFFVCFILKV